MIKTAVVLIATLVSSAGLAQTAIAQTASSAATAAGPVAYVYVTRPTHLDAFAVSSSGKLTPVPGSPFSGIALYHLSVTKKFLFGGSDDHIHINSYSIASNGAVKKVSSVNALNYVPTGCCRLPQRLDASGTTLYNLTDDGGDQAIENFHIASDGHLQFIGNESSNGGGTNYEPGMISILGNNKFAYSTGCDEDVTTEQLTRGFRRESSGLLQRFPPTIDFAYGQGGRHLLSVCTGERSIESPGIRLEAVAPGRRRGRARRLIRAGQLHIRLKWKPDYPEHKGNDASPGV